MSQDRLLFISETGNYEENLREWAYKHNLHLTICHSIDMVFTKMKDKAVKLVFIDVEDSMTVSHNRFFEMFNTLEVPCVVMTPTYGVTAKINQEPDNDFVKAHLYQAGRSIDFTELAKSFQGFSYLSHVKKKLSSERSVFTKKTAAIIGAGLIFTPFAQSFWLKALGGHDWSGVWEVMSSEHSQSFFRNIIIVPIMGLAFWVRALPSLAVFGILAISYFVSLMTAGMGWFDAVPFLFALAGSLFVGAYFNPKVKSGSSKKIAIRAYPRFAFTGPCQAEILDGEALASCEYVNMSKTGALIRTATAVEEGEQLKISIKNDVKVYGKVVRSTINNGQYFLGVSFESLSRRSEDEIGEMLGGLKKVA